MPSLAERARELDAIDPLADRRKLFDLDDSVVYLDGNSLGAPPRSVADRMTEVVREQWGRRLIRSWGEGWWTAPERVGDRIAPLVGAAPGQVVVGDSTSANLFKALVAALRMAEGRKEIVVDAATFPTDGYIASSVARLMGATVRAAALDALELTENTAVVLANQVDYRTGRAYDVGAITSEVHAAGALVLWDLCHSVGALPVDLDAHGVDLAVGCTYKFLNGGPGAPAFLYVPQRLQDSFDQPLAGWNGHREPFAMAPEFEPSSAIARGRCGTPDILSMLALDAALDVWDGVNITDVREKSLALTGFFIDCVDSLVGSRVSVVTPRDSTRGSQVSLACEDAQAVMDALIARDVIGDFRPPNVLRFGFAALYGRYTDALRAASTLADVLT
ncbi:kynureninase [Allokutzneria albata]|uniref:Kynureninase n=1 Tax=Allokutzneria albata TaxID=211114 RepID=A0A1G9WG34_ALLAB|nr:kynureninase [Allokutzneria albata]SDM83524.1 Kynureninase [Allokutzneria albata]